MYARQAIVTRCIGPTNRLSSRIKAKCTAGEVTIPCPHGPAPGVDAHFEAVKVLCAKIDARNSEIYGHKDTQWSSTRWVAGGLPIGSADCYCFVDGGTP